MSTAKGRRAGAVAAILIGMALAAGAAGAQDSFSTERPGSILIFPKVINQNSGTIIQITNTTNMMTYAHCLYTNGQVINGAPVWQVTDFYLALTRQQPTSWRAGGGRPVNPFDGQTGIDPGAIPPVVPGFTGFLVCVEVAVDGTPVGGNNLKGEATIGAFAGNGGVNNVSKYNAIAIPAVGQVNEDNLLELNGIEYAACPRDLLLNFPGDGGPDLALEGMGNVASNISSNISLVPCGFDFENLNPSTTRLNVAIRNEFETPSSLSSGIFVDCWYSQAFADVAPGMGNPLLVGPLGSPFGTAVLTPIGPGTLPALGVLNTLRTADDGTSDSAALNLYWGEETVASEIRLPTFP
jgi:hypothetical protein